MPHSDDLYSANDSDAESFSDELSPRDGYFNPTRMPSDGMVQDPSLDTKEVEPKTLMPTPNPQSRTGETSRTSLHSILPQSNTSRSYASHRSGSNHSTSPSSYTRVSPIFSNRRQPELPRRSLSMSGPPPAYSPPQSPIIPAPQSATYSTFPDQHVERAFLPVREPESMGGPIEEPSETTPLAQQPPTESPFRKYRGFFESQERKRNLLKHFLLVALIFTVATTLLTIMSGQSSTVSLATVFISFVLVTSLNLTDGCTFYFEPIPDKFRYIRLNLQQGSDTNPAIDPITGVPFKPSGSYCARAKHHIGPVSHSFESGETLTVIQSLQRGDWHEGYAHVDTVGQILVRRLPKESENGNSGRLTVDIYVSDLDLPIIKTWNAHSRAFEIKTPMYARFPSSERHCISLEITAWIPEDAEFTNLDIEAMTLTLSVLKDIKINVKESSNFETIDGAIQFPKLDIPYQISQSHSDPEISTSELLALQESTHPFSSRWIQVKTISGRISGTYPLRDYLGISSQSGTIHVDIDPQKELPATPSPATLDIYTTSGAITASLPIGAAYVPPPRKYATQVRTQSGTISGSYYLGCSTLFQSTSSAIRITALPIQEAKAKDRSNTFETSSTSGTIDIKILDPIFLTLQEHAKPTVPYTPIHDKDPYLLLPPPISSELYTIASPDNLLGTAKLRSLDSKHSTTSGSITVHYPVAWEGVFKAHTISASIKTSGPGLRVVRDKKGYVNREIMAFKGVNSEEEGGNVVMGSVSGALRFSVG